MRDLVARLEEWYASNCNGDWEHQFGLRIETLDNPGWMIDIDLSDTNLDDLAFDEVSEERTETDWIFLRKDSHVLKGRGGPRNLHELIERFLCWRAQEPESDDGGI